MPDTPMTPDLDAIRERWATAQSGPWTVDSPYRGDDEQANILGSDGCMVAAFVDPEEQEAIAAAPSDVAALMAWGEHMAAENAELRAEAAQSRQAIDTYVGALAVERAEVTRLRPMEAALAAERAEVERLRARMEADDELISDMRVRVVAWEQALGVTIMPTLDDPDPAIPDGGEGDDKAAIKAALAAVRELHQPVLADRNGHRIQVCGTCCHDPYMTGGGDDEVTTVCGTEHTHTPTGPICPTRAALDGGAT